MSLTSRLKNAWNAFNGRDPTSKTIYMTSGSSYRPDKRRPTRGHERTIVNSIYNRIAMDAAAINVEHVKNDQNGKYSETLDTRLNNCLRYDANLDQTGRAFIQDAVMSMFDEGCIAIVPTDTTDNPNRTQSYDVISMRVGKILEWYPREVKVQLYNENSGKKEDILLSKETVAIVENPFYAVMNEPNSTLQRLIRTLARLDTVNDQNSSGKLDLIIQLPYTIKSQSRRQQAEMRRQEIETQLTGSKYGIAYTDGTEKIIQLNRAIENNLWTQVQDLTAMLYSQLGLTSSIMDGTADEKTMLNYYSRTIEPILSAITDEIQRKFLSKTARSQGQAIRFFRDPFKLVPVSDLAEISDKFTRNEIASPNEMRAEIGWKPSEDQSANELRNRNLNQTEGQENAKAPDAEGAGGSESLENLT